MNTPLLLVTSALGTLDDHPGPNGETVHPNVGRLLTPRHKSRIEDTAAAGIPWACDNDCFQGLDELAYYRMLKAVEGQPGCLFVAVPDVVGDSEETLRRFDEWAPRLRKRGFPLALVAQDGLEDREAPWDEFAALFIGGTTDWKESQAVRDLADEAHRRGKWVHWGRVNTKRRFDLCVAEHGDSFDGSKFARFRKTYLDEGLEWCYDERKAA